MRRTIDIMLGVVLGVALGLAWGWWFGPLVVRVDLSKIPPEQWSAVLRQYVATKPRREKVGDEPNDDSER